MVSKIITFAVYGIAAWWILGRVGFKFDASALRSGMNRFNTSIQGSYARAPQLERSAFAYRR